MKMEKVICKGCGIEFVPKGNDRKTYHSRECAYSHQDQWQWRVKNCEGKTKKKYLEKENKLRSRTCVICNRNIPETEKLNVVYCSDECRKKKGRDYYYANHDRCLETARLHDSKYIIAYHEVECGECGKKFMQTYRDRRSQYCSDKCMRRNTRRNAKHKRKVRLNTAFVERVYWSRIYKRDNGICQICGKKVKNNKKMPHPYSPSLDHIVPLVREGTHEPKNVRLSHFICNSIKRDGVSANGDQLLLFG